MPDRIDLGFTPRSYFRPQALDRFLATKVKNEVLRRRLEAMFDAGQYAKARELLGNAGVTTEDQRAFEHLHPRFMGGNYLPDRDEGEVEIARIAIDSTTCDVTCIYARTKKGRIRYRVVDEYGGDTLTGTTRAATDRPMTLGELGRFFLSAWPLLDVLEMNYEGDLEGQLGFFHASSEFYPEFDRYCRECVIEGFREAHDDWLDDEDDEA